jgi:hypothetical protein
VKRTTITTALLLVTVAGAALSGCVTVPSADMAPGGSVTPSARSVPGPDGKGEPLPVRSPAPKDAKDRAGADEDGKGKEKDGKGKGKGKHGGKGKGAKDAGTTSSDASGGKGGPGDRAGSDGAGRDPGHHLFPPRGSHGGGPQAKDRPARPRKPGGGSVDACGIGTEYGGWRQGSAEEAMCRDLQHRATK